MVGAAVETAALDVVIRMHDPARLDELGRAVFSAALQDHRPVTIIVVCQRFGAAGLGAVRAALTPILAIVPEVEFVLLDREEPAPADARAALLNMGLRAGQGRYAAFLDYDDVIYPEGHRLLIGELESSGTGIAFGGILNADVTRRGLVPMTRMKRRVFQGDGLRQMLFNNYCPVHSYVIDRSRVAVEDLVVDESLALLEDYDLLLRLCARTPSSFRLKDKIIGEYLLKDDGSNVNPVRLAHDPHGWAAAKAVMQARRESLVLSPAVQATLGVDEPGLTVAAYVARQTDLRYG